MRSHPTWVRGLKFSQIGAGEFITVVAPHVGAWIEILTVASEAAPAVASHPTWVRGLKYGSGRKDGHGHGSHPTWVRGLK